MNQESKQLTDPMGARIIRPFPTTYVWIDVSIISTTCKSTYSYLENCQPEPVNTNGMTPLITDQINHAAALIEEQEDIETDDDVRDDFITFSSLLHHNMNNEYFVNFTNRIGFVELFLAYHSQHGDSNLMDFVRMANRVGLTST